MPICPSRWLDATVRIAVIGCGGTGSALIDGLCSLDATLRQLGHPGFEITAQDGDSVSASNVGRARFTMADVGLNKAILLAHRMSLFYGTRIKGVPEHFTAGNRQNADLYITATDSAKLRADFPRWIGPYSRAFWLDAGNGDRSGQLVWGSLGDPTSEGYIPNVVDLFPELRDKSFQAAQREVPTCSTEEALRQQSWPINRALALHMSDMLYQIIRHGSCEHNGLFCSVSPPSVQLIHANNESWAQFGWRAQAQAKAA